MVDQQLVGAIALPDGTMIRGRGRREPFPTGPLPDFGLYLGRPPDKPPRTPFRQREHWNPDWPADWIDWPDFRTPRNDALAAATTGAEPWKHLASAVGCTGSLNTPATKAGPDPVLVDTHTLDLNCA